MAEPRTIARRPARTALRLCLWIGLPIGLLAAWLLPAVRQARHAAWRAQDT